MSAHMKTHLTKVAVGNKQFNLPTKDVKAVLSLIKFMNSTRTDTRNGYMGWLVVFLENFKNIPEWVICLRAARRRKKLSQKVSSEKCQIPITTLSKYEKGVLKIQKDHVHKLAKVLQVNYKAFLTK